MQIETTFFSMFRAGAAAVIVMLAAAGPASAAKLSFGTKEYLEKIQDTAIKGQNNEALYLGYKYSHHSFIAPYSLTDDGYILGVVGQDRYYTLTPELLAQFQSQGLLPKPLPAYEISWFDWIFGHLLWIVGGLIGLSMLWAARGKRKAQAALPLAEAALEHHRAGRIDEAIAGYDKAIAVRALPDVLMLRADAYREKGEGLKAIADYSAVLKQNAKHGGALFRRAGTFHGLGRHDEALADLNRVVALEAGNPDVLLARGQVQAAKGADRLAVTDLTAALAIEPARADVLIERAAAYDRLGEARSASADRDQAARLQEAARHAG